ncbi:MAG TPA: hypothetical protein DCS09_08410 [Porphyromonadaceae bacterium]|nr:hypothetical protein [Porphyromonadaceae bacterium]
MTKAQIAERLKQLVNEMIDLSAAMDNHKGCTGMDRRNLRVMEMASILDDMADDAERELIITGEVPK